MKRKKIIFFAIVFCLIAVGTGVMFAAPNINLSIETNENIADLSWVNNDSVKSYNYDVKKSVNGGEFKSLDENDGNKVKVLNVYPDSSAVNENISFTTYDGENVTIKKSASLKQWMETPNADDSRGYGRGLIEVTPVSITDFNNNPSTYLFKEDNGEYNYQVVVFGTWDSNGSQDISQAAEDVMRVYLQEGNSCIMGHDTIANSATNDRNFNDLRSYFNLKLYQLDNITLPGGGVQEFVNLNQPSPTNVTLRTNNVFTTYPWKIGNAGDVLSVPQCHTVGQIAYGNVEITFSSTGDLTDQYGNGNWNYYLTVYNNTAMIQTGHSNCEATSDEQKIWANLLFYLGDVNTETTAVDNDFVDINAPDKPTITNNNLNGLEGTVEYVAEDNGTTYEYYVEASERTTLETSTSNTVSSLRITGVKGYSYVVDNIPDTIPDDTIDTSSNSIDYTIGDGPNTYLHIKTFDGAGNVSDVTHVLLYTNVGPEMELSQNPTEWTNGNVVITADATDTDGRVVSIKKPDGSIENASSTTYEVEQNGTYEFVATDNSGETVTESIEITNIDKVKPQGEYSVEQPTEDVRAAVISISAKDNESGVSKIIKPDGTEVTEDSTTYSVTEPDTYTFKVVDVAGNETEVYVTVTIVSDGVDVRYVDIKHEDNILHEYSINGNVEDEYTTQQNEYEGYRFVKVEGNASGSLAIDKQTVTYYYIKQSNVNVYHKDEITGEVLQQEIPATYDEGEEYTTSKKEIVGYTQTSDSKNTAGTVEREDIEVTYYYKKNTSVTVKYVDMVTGDTLDSTKIDGLENDEYTTEKKDIEGYEYIETQGKANGKNTRSSVNVVYYYKKVSNLITEHIDANTGDKIIEDVVTGYKEGDRYEALPQNLEGYIVVESPKETTGTMGREDVVKTFYYKKISAGLTVKYVDDITGELLDSKEYTGNEKDVITLEEKSFKYYVVTGRPDFSEVELTVKPQEVVYYYTRVSKVEIEGIDQDTSEVIYETEVTGLEGDKYETYPRQLEGYELVVVPENQNGEYKRENEKVVYEYRKVAGKLTVKYVDDETEEILESYEIEGLRGDSYKTEKKEFEGYKLVRVEGEEIGELTEEGKEVIYHYEKKTGKIIVRYVDEEGNNIVDPEIMTGKVGEEYKVEEKEIKNYKIKEYPKNTEGVYTEETIEVRYVMEKLEGKVIVNLIDEKGNVMDKIEKEGYVGEIYELQLPEKEGYELTGDKYIKVEIVEGEQVINVYYTKIEEAPQTGDINIYLYVVAIVVSAYIIRKILKKRFE